MNKVIVLLILTMNVERVLCVIDPGLKTYCMANNVFDNETRNGYGECMLISTYSSLLFEIEKSTLMTRKSDCDTLSIVIDGVSWEDSDRNIANSFENQLKTIKCFKLYDNIDSMYNDLPNNPHTIRYNPL